MYRVFLIILIALIVFSCSEKMPGNIDGAFVFSTVVLAGPDIVSIHNALGNQPLVNAKATLYSKNYNTSGNNNITYIGYSDEYGKVTFINLPAGEYGLFVEATIAIPDVPTEVTLVGSSVQTISDTRSSVDTILIDIPGKRGIKLNEIYYCGPVNIYSYVFDQFIELYNSSDQEIYLDGMIIGKVRQTPDENLETNPFVQLSEIYQFPGSGINQVIYPGEFIVLASDAFNHHQYFPTSVDLSSADYEFYNEYGDDIDYPSPNLTNLKPERRADFLMNLITNAVIIADGTQWEYGVVNDDGSQYIHVPTSTIIDAVQYHHTGLSDPDLQSYLDGGFAGIGMLRYSAKSIERCLPGYDTNNSGLDFIITDHPTPGYHH